MSKIKRLIEDIWADYESEVFSITELAEKYHASEKLILDAIDLHQQMEKEG